MATILSSAMKSHTTLLLYQDCESYLCPVSLYCAHYLPISYLVTTLVITSPVLYCSAAVPVILVLVSNGPRVQWWSQSSDAGNWDKPWSTSVEWKSETSWGAMVINKDGEVNRESAHRRLCSTYEGKPVQLWAWRHQSTIIWTLKEINGGWGKYFQHKNKQTWKKKTHNVEQCCQFKWRKF